MEKQSKEYVIERTRMPFYDDNEVGKACFYYGTTGYPNLHCHKDFWEFIIVIEGVYHHTFNDNLYEQRKNEVYLLRPDDAHKIKEKNKDSKYLNICFTDTFFQNFLEPFPGELYDSLKKRECIKFKITQTLANQLVSITNAYFASSKDRFILTCHQLLLALSSEMIAYASKSKPTSYSESIQQFISLLSNPKNLALPLNELIAKTHYSYSRMNTIFKGETGVTPSEYLRTRRLNYAKKMLLYAKAKSVEISSDIGFATPARFCLFFKERTGYTPTEYVKKFGKKR